MAILTFVTEILKFINAFLALFGVSSGASVVFWILFLVFMFLSGAALWFVGKGAAKYVAKEDVVIRENIGKFASIIPMVIDYIYDFAKGLLNFVRDLLGVVFSIPKSLSGVSRKFLGVLGDIIDSVPAMMGMATEYWRYTRAGDRGRKSIIASFVLLATVSAFISSFVFVHSVTSSYFSAFAAALFWALFIFCFECMIASSRTLINAGGWVRFWTFVVRFMVSFMVGIVVTDPLISYLFKEEIVSEILKDKYEDPTITGSGMSLHAMRDKIDKREQVNIGLGNILSAASGRDPVADQQIALLEKQKSEYSNYIRTKEKYRNLLNAGVSGEVLGKPYVDPDAPEGIVREITPKKPGCGSRCKEWQRRSDALSGEIDDLKKKDNKASTEEETIRAKSDDRIKDSHQELQKLGGFGGFVDVALKNDQQDQYAQVEMGVRDKIARNPILMSQKIYGMLFRPEDAGMFIKIVGVLAMIISIDLLTIISKVMLPAPSYDEAEEDADETETQAHSSPHSDESVKANVLKEMIRREARRLGALDSAWSALLDSAPLHQLEEWIKNLNSANTWSEVFS